MAAQNYIEVPSYAEAALNHAVPHFDNWESWEEVAFRFRAQRDGGPTLKIIDGDIWADSALGLLARFESSEQAERMLLTAGFRFIPAEMGFRA